MVKLINKGISEFRSCFRNNIILPNTIGILLVYTLLHKFTTFIIIPSAVGMQSCCNATTEAHTARVKSQQAIGGIT